MRVFKLDELRDIRPCGGDGLVDRFHAVDQAGRPIQLLALLAEGAPQTTPATFLEQAARNRACTSEGLVRVLDFGTHVGRPGEACSSRAYISLERAENAVSLAAALALLRRREESMSPLLAAHVALELCETLALAHDLVIEGAPRPLYHGDLCAERVILCNDGQVQVSELGLLLALPAERREAGRAAGAYDHVLPGNPIDAHADAYAVGVLLRRMLTNARTGECLVPDSLQSLLEPLLSRTAATSPPTIAQIRDALSMQPRHAAGRAALAQLNGDVRRAEPHPNEAAAVSEPPTVFVAPSSVLTGEVPQLAASAHRDPPSFRSRTQVALSDRAMPRRSADPPTRALSIGSSLSKASRDALASLGQFSARGEFGTVRLSRDELPSQLTSALRAPVLSTAPGAEPSNPSSPASRRELTGAPALLLPKRSAVGSSAFPEPAGLERHPSNGVGHLPAPFATSHTSNLQGSSALTGTAASEQPLLAARQLAEPAALAKPLLGETRSPQLPVAAPALSTQVSGHASSRELEHLRQRKHRAPWKDPSDTVFKLKSYTGVRSVVPYEGASPKAMFILAALFTALAVLGIGLAFRLLL